MTATNGDKKQSVWIIRYGLTKFPLVESLGPFDSPVDPTEGVEHAKCIASRIATSTDAPKIVYSSPFVRTAETGHILASQCECPVRVEQGLTEWLTPSLLVEPNGVKTEPKPLSELASMYSTIDASYQSRNPVVPDDASDVREGAPHFVETEAALLKRCATTIEELLEASNGQSFAIVSHAPCDQAIAYHLEGAKSESKLTPWPLGGITKFSRVGHGDWTMELYGNTKHMPGKYKPGIKHWSLPCLDKKS